VKNLLELRDTQQFVF